MRGFKHRRLGRERLEAETGSCGFPVSLGTPKPLIEQSSAQISFGSRYHHD